jgi:hypothetical protein
VADRAETTITLTDAPHDDERAVTAEGLRAYNEGQRTTRLSQELRYRSRVLDPPYRIVCGFRGKSPANPR